MIRIGRLKTKPPTQEHRQGNPYYQTKEWKYKKELVWLRDERLCQLCLSKNIIHPLIRGTRDLSKQGTVDHKIPREAGGTDDLDNLWLIGSNHHARKSNKDKIYY